MPAEKIVSLEKALLLFGLASILLTSGCLDVIFSRPTGTHPGNSVDCGIIQDAQQQSDCFVAQAIEKDDATLCGKATAQPARDDCFLQLGKAHQRIDWCVQIVSNEKESQCADASSSKLTSISVCDAIPSGTEKDDCIRDVARIQKNAGWCTQIPLQKDICLEEVARASHNAATCVGISNDITRDDCYYRIGIQKDDTTICNPILAEKTKSECIYEIATHIKDPQLCDRIPSVAIRAACYAFISKSTK